MSASTSSPKSVTKILKTTPDLEDTSETGIPTSPFELPRTATPFAVSQVYYDRNTAKSDLASSKEQAGMIPREEPPLIEGRAIIGSLKRKRANDCELGSNKKNPIIIDDDDDDDDDEDDDDDDEDDVKDENGDDIEDDDKDNVEDNDGDDEHYGANRKKVQKLSSEGSEDFHKRSLAMILCTIESLEEIREQNVMEKERLEDLLKNSQDVEKRLTGVLTFIYNEKMDLDYLMVA